ncbi:MAG: beta-mannosidase [Actinobacteria bacterium]|nr:beta-mannosidase [Actinomycetota bacterium]
MYRQGLNKDWKLRYEELYYNKDYYAEISEKKDSWYDVETLPCDIHIPLIEKGEMGDPVIADNCFKCEWIENKSWWFKKVFRAGKELITSENSELVIEGLDAEADLFLNGVHLGHHKSTTYPFRKDIRDILNEGENILVIRVTSGLEYYSEFELSKIKDFIRAVYKTSGEPRGDDRRVFVRKPSYVYGWDWNPRIATCGIMGDARIEAYNEIAIRNVKFTTKKLSGETAEVTVEAEIENLYPITTLDAVVDFEIIFDDITVQSMQKDLFMTAGVNYVTFDLTINDAKLWWPNGLGEQNLYKIKISAKTAKGSNDNYEFKTGIRTIKLNTDKINGSSRMFFFEVNGTPVFGKGGNWETPDSLYGRITDDKYERLVSEAKEANFNMFRFNGVNAYERDYFYDCCDRYGILIWQDFTFSVSAYPDEVEWFRHEAEKEVDYQTKRLCNHPCIALWCGSNECQWSLTMFSLEKSSYFEGDKKPASPGGTILWNEVMPRIIRNNSPDIPFWNSSPFGGMDLNSNEYGNNHRWHAGFMNDDMIVRITPEEYDKIACKFISEFGCVGPTKKSSIYNYYGSEDIDIKSSIWKLHTNTFEKDTVKAAIAKHYTDPETLSLDGYLLYAGLFQGMMLGYAFESMRNAKNNFGGLVWSYNDCWGEVGWSIIDYYLTRKISFYFVKRALAHKKLIMRESGNMIDVVCLNDTRDLLEFDLEYGYQTFEGGKKDAEVKRVIVQPSSKAAVIAQFKKSSHDTLKGLYYASPGKRSGMTPALLRSADFRNLLLSHPEIRINDLKVNGENTFFTVTSDKYVHGVHFGLKDDLLLSDEYFDLLAGESRGVTVSGKDAPASIDKINPKYVYVRQ